MHKEAPDLDRPLLILDLDETLIHAREEALDRPATSKSSVIMSIGSSISPISLNGVRADFDLAAWSSASDDYVTGVVSHLFGTEFPLRFVWGGAARR